MIDLQIEGRGFYSIAPTSRKGSRWLKRCFDGVGNVLMCDDGNACRDIIRAANDAGLTVTVNGLETRCCDPEIRS